MVKVERACDVCVRHLSISRSTIRFRRCTGFEINEHSGVDPSPGPPARSPQPLVTPMPRTLRNLPTRAPHSQPPTRALSPRRGDSLLFLLALVSSCAAVRPPVGAVYSVTRWLPVIGGQKITLEIVSATQARLAMEGALNLDEPVQYEIEPSGELKFTLTSATHRILRRFRTSLCGAGYDKESDTAHVTVWPPLPLSVVRRARTKLHNTSHLCRPRMSTTLTVCLRCNMSCVLCSACTSSATRSETPLHASCPCCAGCGRRCAERRVHSRERCARGRSLLLAFCRSPFAPSGGAGRTRAAPSRDKRATAERRSGILFYIYFAFVLNSQLWHFILYLFCGFILEQLGNVTVYSAVAREFNTKAEQPGILTHSWAEQPGI